LPDGKVQVLTQGAYKRIKDEAREKGKKEALAELDAEAKTHGFSSYKEMLAAAAKSARGGNPNNGGRGGRGNDDEPRDPPRRDPDPNNDRESRRARDRQQRQAEEARIATQRAQRRAQEEASRRRELQRQLDEKDAEMVLRQTAVSVGVKDVDYAIHLLRSSMKGKSESELAQFDEGKFFEALRNDRPYLFGEVVKPANTGTGGSAPPPAPKPAPGGGNGKPDVKNMKPQEFNDYLRSKGLSLS
jgi:hypothetical protein